MRVCMYADCGSFRTSICVYTREAHVCTGYSLWRQRSLAHTETTQVNRNVFHTVCLSNRKLRTTCYIYICWNVDLRVRRPTIRDCYSNRLHFVTLCFEWFLIFELIRVGISLSSTRIQPYTSTHTLTITIIAHIHIHILDVCTIHTAYKLRVLYKYYHCICSLELALSIQCNAA